MLCKRCKKKCEARDLSATGYCENCCEAIIAGQQEQAYEEQSARPPHKRAHPKPELNIKLVRKKGEKDVSQMIRSKPRYIPSYMAKAIFSMICCCEPLGIVALIFACITNSCIARGDHAGALKASNRADTWGSCAIIVGIMARISLCISCLL